MKLKLISIISASILLAACGSGSVSESSNDNYNANAPKGPASYTYYSYLDKQGDVASQTSILSATGMNYFSSISLDNAPGASCSKAGKIPIFSFISNAVGFVNYFEPEIKPLKDALGAIGNIKTIYDDTGDISGTSNLCIENQISQVNGRIDAIQSQLNNINSIMETTDGFIMQEITNNAQSSLAIAYNNYIANVNKMIGSQAAIGIYDEIMDVANFDASATSIQNLSQNPGQTTLLAIEYAINAPEVSQLLFDLSGATYDRDTCATSSGSCQGDIQAASSADSSLILVLNLSYKLLQDTINSTLQNNSGSTQDNIVALYDEYNQFITSLYHLSLTPITEIYYLDRIANQVNIASADFGQLSSNSYIVEIPTMTYIPKTHYSATMANTNTATSSQLESVANQNFSDYTTAQTNLNLFYAAIVNRLYENIANYIVTDAPVPNQLTTSEDNLWTGNNDGFSITYQDSDGNDQTITIVNQVDYENIIATQSFSPINNPGSGDGYFHFALNNALNPNTVLYQAPQLRNINQCMSYFTSSIQQGNTNKQYEDGFNSTTCPAFFPELSASNTGYFSAGNPENNNGIIQPIYIDTSSSPAQQKLYGAMYGVYHACQADSELVTYSPTVSGNVAQVGTNYLTCRQWKTSDEFSNETLIGSSWTANAWFGVQYNTSQESRNNWQSWTPIQPPRPVSGSVMSDFGSWYVTNASTMSNNLSADPYFTGSAGNIGINISSSDNVFPLNNGYWIYAGNMGVNYQNNQDSNVHMLALSVEIDGFYYPLVYQFWNRSGETGNGFSVVQNNRINNVGFYDFETETKTPLAQSSNATTPFQQPLCYNCDHSYSSLTYHDHQPLSSTGEGLYTVMNNVVFWLNGDITTWGSGNTVQGAQWQSDSMYVEYGLASEMNVSL